MKVGEERISLARRSGRTPQCMARMDGSTPTAYSELHDAINSTMRRASTVVLGC